MKTLFKIIKTIEYESQLPKVKLLNTTRRIREFSSGKDIKVNFVLFAVNKSDLAS